MPTILLLSCQVISFIKARMDAYNLLFPGLGESKSNSDSGNSSGDNMDVDTEIVSRNEAISASVMPTISKPIVKICGEVAEYRKMTKQTFDKLILNSTNCAFTRQFMSSKRSNCKSI